MSASTKNTCLLWSPAQDDIDRYLAVPSSGLVVFVDLTATQSVGSRLVDPQHRRLCDEQIGLYDTPDANCAVTASALGFMRAHLHGVRPLGGPETSLFCAPTKHAHVKVIPDRGPGTAGCLWVWPGRPLGAARARALVRRRLLVRPVVHKRR